MSLKVISSKSIGETQLEKVILELNNPKIEWEFLNQVFNIK